MALTARDVLACKECRAEMRRPGLLHACASVGIEHGKTGRRVLLEYLAGFHRAGHVRGDGGTEYAPASNPGGA